MADMAVGDSCRGILPVCNTSPAAATGNCEGVCFTGAAIEKII